MIDIVENSISKTLLENFPEFDVQPFPVDFEQFNYTSSVGCFLTRFENMVFQAQSTLTAVNCNVDYNFTVFFSARYLQNHREAYQFLKKIIRLLNGLNILNKRLTLKKLAFEDEINGDLWYSLGVCINLPVVDENKNLSISDDPIETLFGTSVGAKDGNDEFSSVALRSTSVGENIGAA